MSKKGALLKFASISGRNLRLVRWAKNKTYPRNDFTFESNLWINFRLLAARKVPIKMVIGCWSVRTYCAWTRIIWPKFKSSAIFQFDWHGMWTESIGHGWPRAGWVKFHHVVITKAWETKALQIWLQLTLFSFLYFYNFMTNFGFSYFKVHMTQFGLLINPKTKQKLRYDFIITTLIVCHNISLQRSPIKQTPLN